MKDKMKGAASAGGGGGQFLPLCGITMSSASLKTSWLHCDQISTLCSKLVSLESRHASIYGNLVSTIVNSVAELVYLHHDDSDVKLLLLRRGSELLLELEFSAGEGTRRYYRDLLAEIQKADLENLMLKSFESEEVDCCRLSTYELVASYRARLDFTEIAAARVKLSVTVNPEAIVQDLSDTK